jgi:nucleoid-associated protein YgaU
MSAYRIAKGKGYIMRNGKRVTEMNDREYRIYKRNLRRQQEIRRRTAVLAATFFLVLLTAVSYSSIKSNAGNGNDMKFKYYTAITVQSGDTLWSIADDYIDYSEYKNKEAYIAEVKSINRLDDTADIRSGQKLTVPYYSSEFVK